MARYLILDESNQVINIVEYRDEVPPEFDSEGHRQVADPGNMNVGDIFDVEAWQNLAAREAGVALFSEPVAHAKALRAIVSILVTQFNALRQQTVNTLVTTLDPPNLANNTGFTSPNIALTGAILGDMVDVSAPYSLQGLLVTVYVVSSGQVAVRIHNSTGGAINLASGSWKIAVRRPLAQADITMAQAKAAILALINAGTVDS